MVSHWYWIINDILNTSLNILVFNIYIMMLLSFYGITSKTRIILI